MATVPFVAAAWRQRDALMASGSESDHVIHPSCSPLWPVGSFLAAMPTPSVAGRGCPLKTWGIGP